MTIETLQQKPEGLLDIRSFTWRYKGKKYKENYYLVKGKSNKYYIGFSINGSYCSELVCAEEMVNLINNKELSDSEAMDIYMSMPQLTCWMDD